MTPDHALASPLASDATISPDQAAAVQRAIGLMATWLAATTPDGLARHRATLARLVLDDDAAGEPGRLAMGLVTLASQLLTITADLTETHELDVLDAIAEAFAPPT